MRFRGRLVAAGGVAVVAVATLGWLAVTAQQARAELVAAQAELGPLRGEVLSGDPVVNQRISALRQHAKAAQDKTHDPVWAAVAAIPWLGSPAATVRGITTSIAAVSEQGLPALSAASSDVHPARLLEGGRIDVSGLGKASEPLETAAAALQQQRDAVGDLPPSWIGPVAQARADLHEQLVTLADLTGSAATAARIAPDMLGENGPRRYLVGFQNPNEARGTGGFLDAYAIVRAEDGKLVVEKTGTHQQLPTLPAQIDGLDEAFVERYSGVGATSLWVNSNLSPDFPEVGAAWMAMWRAATGEQLDGAVMLDPHALAQVLTATGPVTAPGVGTVSGEDVVDLVLLEQYRRKDFTTNDQRKRLMLQVGVEAMDAVLAGKASPQTLVPKLRTATAGGHVLLYSTTPQVQSVLVDSDLAGAVDQGMEPFAQAVVVNAGGNKLDTWLHQSLSYQVLECRAGGRTVEVTVKLLNAAPTTGLPQYVTVRSDKPLFKTVTGQNRAELQVMVTQGATLSQATVDGYPVPLAPPEGDLPATLPTGGLAGGGLDSGLIDIGVTAGRPAFGLNLELVPDVPRTVVFRFTEPAGTTGAPRLPVQTMVNAPTVDSDVSACGEAS